MLTKKQVSEIREHLQHANEPLFLFDNDPDGLCSFLLLRKYIDKGKGFPIRSFPDLNESYFKKVQELNPDMIFILDKPVVSKEFFDRVHEINLPVVWIDHHDIDKNEIPPFVNYYNPLFNRKKGNEPVTALCRQINPDKGLAWLAVVGCVADHFTPKFYKGVKKAYPDLAIDSDEPFDIFYNSDLGKIARVFGFALKDKTTNVINMLRFLMKANTPYEVLTDSPKNHAMHHRFEQVEAKYQKLVKKAFGSAKKEEKLLFFQYGGDMSMSADISNFLSYRFPEKIVVVVYVMGIKANISVRGKNAREKVLKAIDGLPGATGGGHEDAVGAQVSVNDLETFKKRIETLA